MSKHEQQEFSRGLKERHIQLIGIGGAIGVGLFLGSATAIQTAGPALILSYGIGGLILYFILRALGELAVYKPVAGSFSAYAEEFIGPWAGFVTGWTYWFMWIVTGMAEITAVGVYARYWFPEVPQWIPALIALVVIYGLNLIAVKLFGELEFWFSLIKVVTILALIGIGLAVITTGFGNGGHPVGFSNLWEHGGFFPHGAGGVLLTLQMVMFAFLGGELIGVTAGEAENPKKTLPSAINKFVWRILIFYIGALAVIMAMYPWNELDGKTSPFVLIFEKIGIVGAAGIVNFVVMTAALSSCNSGVFSTGRMIYTLSNARQAPQFLGQLNRRRVPARALTASTAVLLVGVFLNYVIPEEAFIYVTSVATVGALWTWGIIVYAHMKYRRKVEAGVLPEGEFRLYGAPWVNWLVMAFLLLVLVLLWFDEGTRVALYVAPVWFGLLAAAYQFVRRKRATVEQDDTEHIKDHHL
ncbi:putative amino acid permease YtnA [Marinithermofilum abyssi]|uniref:Putative amino acid permease YtnA n=1 Tax=Marinithermofilum abyssi TaxID=1571185 RepID=A0A8J2VG47_9BACL|nr:amino acid permease [Marinithermofilum abyssi]GGE19273.1 putative amino acid permease YtnA [Marinithermofilum abyssi]